MHIIQHLRKEEKQAGDLIKIVNHARSQEEWNQLFYKIKDEIEHHASEEETKLFPMAERLFDFSQLEQIGDEMMRFKEEYDYRLKPR